VINNLTRRIGAVSGIIVFCVFCGCLPCDGILSPEGRWCDQENGTVKDMDTGLVWLKDASWGGQYPLSAGSISDTNAHDRASKVRNGIPITLTDGSETGDWRLPTRNELWGIAGGAIEHVRSDSPQFFTGVQDALYWTSTTAYFFESTERAYLVHMHVGISPEQDQDYNGYVWPVRNDY